MLQWSEEEAAARLLKRRQSRDSLLSFADYTHPRWQTGAHHKWICDALEEVERGDCKRLIISAPPRHTKSELASKRFPAWYMGRNPHHQLITATYSADLATDFGADVKDIVRSYEYKAVFPGIDIHPDRKAHSRWVITKGGIYIAAGVGGPITGRGANLAIIDDPIKNREDADSPRKRERVWRWFWSTLYTRLMPEGAIVLMMTRWHDDDLAARLLRDGGWDLLEMPAIENEDTDDEIALWPEWYPIDVLNEKKASMPLREWSALYQQKPTVDTGSYCKRVWYEPRYDEKPKYLTTFIASDYAVKKSTGEEDEGRGPDYTEHGVFGVMEDDGAHVYTLDWWYGRTTPEEWIDSLLDLAKIWKPSGYYSEGGVIRHAIEPLLRRRIMERSIWLPVTDSTWMPSMADKEARGRSFQGRSSMGRWHFPKTPWADRIVEQCVSFPGGSFDDGFDVCSLAGRVIDKMYPATAPSGARREPRDRWANDVSKSDWKTA